MQNFHKSIINYWVKKVIHNRAVPVGEDYLNIRAITTVLIKVNGQEFLGESRCSIKDNFVRKIGYQMALGRALKKAYAYEEQTNG